MRNRCSYWGWCVCPAEVAQRERVRHEAPLTLPLPWQPPPRCSCFVLKDPCGLSVLWGERAAGWAADALCRQWREGFGCTGPSEAAASATSLGTDRDAQYDRPFHADLTRPQQHTWCQCCPPILMHTDAQTAAHCALFSKSSTVYGSLYPVWGRNALHWRAAERGLAAGEQLTGPASGNE